jgi:23S rRNA pseudouridine1911/1915/1917 synthase
MPMPRPPWPVLFEDNHLLVVAKPALLPTMGVVESETSLLTQAKDYIKQKYNKPAGVYLGIVSRLDAPVTGVVVLARTSKAAARLTEQFRAQKVEKVYWAVVEGAIRPESGRLVDFMRKDERHRRMHIARATDPEAKRAALSYQTRRRLVGGTLVEVRLETGRKHQIRVQLSHAGHPIHGDRKYGSRTPFSSGIALHARSLVLEHPVSHEPLEFVAPLPRSWQSLGVTV